MAKRITNKTLSENRKARHDYFVEEAMEAGIELVGTEVKSLRAGKANLKDSYAEIKDGEVFIRNMHVSHYEQGNIFNVDPMRDRKLLLHKEEIRRLVGLLKQSGFTLIPLSLYLKNGKVKVNLGVCRGKKNYDKRDALIEKAQKRDIERQMKERLR
ncbi:MAG: SsrA-binding protein SmpB [Inconstantimicrobium porci]|uniref:SsrA-binding protein n=1 Tax=Inconstantimicrobium porci TaxID=2652291 RepID=A0A7X2T1K3_9CLOT|nr:SsrA-binding protein SmpB [Inconstantimicrobium porci]MDD6770739.1 SsrA-binding protein SmpB [Inconstantimicrobium porci]MDY5913451.1 SsrA-binding protein SmpB [Inconstantimicrobium porci]MSR91741.1 SsrA-binding protein SmpB [Inconstantimicrobium porci]